MLICIILINIEEVDHEHRLQPVRRDSQEKYNPVSSGRKPGKEKHESFSSCSKQHKQTANADQPLQGKATVHGVHRSKRKNKNGEIKINVSIEFKTPTKSGRKCALLNKCKIISQYFNTGWKQIIQKEVKQEKA